MKRPILVGEAYLRAIIDAFPSPVLIVDEQLIVHDANAAAKTILGNDMQDAVQRLCGDTLRCKHAIQSSGSCGSTDHCPECIIRLTAQAISNGRPTFRRMAAMYLERNGSFEAVRFLVTGAPLQYGEDNFVVLVLEDITELTDLRRIVPICSFCRKVRDDSDYWQRVDEYLKKYSTIQFSHGVCPDCAGSTTPASTCTSEPTFRMPAAFSQSRRS